MIAKGRGGKARGETAGRSKLTNKQVLKIRQLYSQDFSIAEISRLFLVSWFTIKDIISRKTWNHII
jgi:predicted DNA-binding protein YlxM (UPF0122 family)